MESGERLRRIIFHTVLALLLMAGWAGNPVRASQGTDSLYHGFLYYPRLDTGFLKSVEKRFPSGLSGRELALAVMKELLEEPAAPGLGRILPRGTALRALFITDDGAAYIDLETGNIRDDHGGVHMDTQGEYLAIYAIANSLIVNVPQIRKVKILLNGQESQTLAGHVELDCFYQTNLLIVK